MSEALAGVVGSLETYIQEQPACNMVEPTNNAAERALRHPVIWRRTSHGTQSDHGSLFVQRVLTIAETCRLQRRSVLDFVRSSVIAYRSGLPAPSLLPTALDH